MFCISRGEAERGGESRDNDDKHSQNILEEDIFPFLLNSVANFWCQFDVPLISKQAAFILFLPSHANSQGNVHNHLWNVQCENC